MENDIDKANERCAQAHRELMERLFGKYPEDLSSCTVSRERYTEEMKSVQEKYTLQEGDPDFLCWMLYQLGEGKSPQFTDGEEDDDATATAKPAE